MMILIFEGWLTFITFGTFIEMKHVDHWKPKFVTSTHSKKKFLHEIEDKMMKIPPRYSKTYTGCVIQTKNRITREINFLMTFWTFNSRSRDMKTSWIKSIVSIFIRMQMKPMTGNINSRPKLKEHGPFGIEHRQNKTQTHCRTSID